MPKHTDERQPPQTDSSLAYSCPRYAACSAAFCPAIGGRHLKDEPVCAWLREGVKPGGRAILEGALAGNLAEAVLGAARHSLSAPGALGRELRRAAELGSKLESGRHLQAVSHAVAGCVP